MLSYDFHGCITYCLLHGFTLPIISLTMNVYLPSEKPLDTCVAKLQRLSTAFLKLDHHTIQGCMQQLVVFLGLIAFLQNLKVLFVNLLPHTADKLIGLLAHQQIWVAMKIIRQVVRVVLAVLADQYQLLISEFFDVPLYRLGTTPNITSNHLDSGVAQRPIAHVSD